MTLMGIVQDFKGLLIARLFLGVTEAGLYPGVAYYITMWYCRTEAQFRQAMFFSAASVAGAFSGILAFGIAVSIHVLNEHQLLELILETEHGRCGGIRGLALDIHTRRHSHRARSLRRFLHHLRLS